MGNRMMDALLTILVAMGAGGDDVPRATTPPGTSKIVDTAKTKDARPSADRTIKSITNSIGMKLTRITRGRVTDTDSDFNR